MPALARVPNRETVRVRTGIRPLLIVATTAVFAAVAGVLPSASAAFVSAEGAGPAFSPLSEEIQLLSNPSFADGLDGWSLEGGTDSGTGFAVVRDTQPLNALWQAAAVPDLGFVRLSFEFRADLLSSEVPAGTFPDFFSATLESGPSADVFSATGGVGVASVPLFTADASTGIYDLHPDARIEPSPTRPEWNFFSITVEYQDAYGSPFFRLFDQNSIADDSAFPVTDVEMVATPIPEPSSTVIGTGLLALAFVVFYRIRRKLGSFSNRQSPV